MAADSRCDATGAQSASNYGLQLPNRRNLLRIGEQSYEGGRHLVHGKALERRVVRQNVRTVGRGTGERALGPNALICTARRSKPRLERRSSRIKHLSLRNSRAVPMLMSTRSRPHSNKETTNEMGCFRRLRAGTRLPRGTGIRGSAWYNGWHQDRRCDIGCGASQLSSLLVAQRPSAMPVGR